MYVTDTVSPTPSDSTAPRTVYAKQMANAELSDWQELIGELDMNVFPTTSSRITSNATAVEPGFTAISGNLFGWEGFTGELDMNAVPDRLWPVTGAGVAIMNGYPSGWDEFAGELDMNSIQVAQQPPVSIFSWNNGSVRTTEDQTSGAAYNAISGGMSWHNVLPNLP